QHGEEAIHDAVPVLRIELRRQVHGPLHVCKQHRHLLALAFESAAVVQNPLGQVARRVGAWTGRLTINFRMDFRLATFDGGGRRTARIAETRARTQRGATRTTVHVPWWWRRAAESMRDAEPSATPGTHSAGH